ncbi:hypothetical protein L1787_05995 [Acuticoccus sp. M5D2P5]|uniref:hypothetical protein n=1 Tax=Acuticoccus kalidii TaxID=2910977 RepID=UPI001F1AF1A4|nr:hypothetical protein [Acuticoccus kalidii]MCF3932965.1 hypothetical protein [Acuticoccus kalidii]
MEDPVEKIERLVVNHPPASGRGSSKEAWKAYTTELVDAAADLLDLLAQKEVTISKQAAEIARLQKQILARKPRGGRPKTASETTDRIERAISEGRSTRDIAKFYGVSAMTVSRIGQRMRERTQQ